MKKFFKEYWILFVIVLLGAFVRMYNVNWDHGHRLHPDERFLAMVMNDMTLPESFQDYLKPNTSTFNPVNVGHEFFVYGAFPTTANKLIAILLGNDDYGNLALQGRVFSAAMDAGVIVLLYFNALELVVSTWSARTKKFFAVLASFSYAAFVLPIQLSHFFATDTFAQFFAFAALLGVLCYRSTAKLLPLLTAAIMLPLAIASKVSVLYFTPVIIAIFIDAVIAIYRQTTKKLQRDYVISLFVQIPILLLLAYCVIRVASPHYFQGPTFFSIQPSEKFLDNIEQLQSWSGPDVWFPPSFQWRYTVPILHPILNIGLTNIGLGFSLIFLYGFLRLIHTGVKKFSYIRKEARPELYLFIWSIGFFLYQSTQFIKANRYFYLLFPLLALVVSYAFIALKEQLQTTFSNIHTKYLLSFVVILCLIWPAMFMNIYVQDHSRQTASEWIYNNVPKNSLLITEHWDDGIPLPIPGYSTLDYQGRQAEVFLYDDPQKWQKLNQLLDEADYYVITSKRAWKHIQVLRDDFPQQAKFYDELFAGTGDFRKISEFTVYPSLAYLGIPLEFNDDWTDETFTVYDHPKVMIFEKVK